MVWIFFKARIWDI